MGIFCWEKTFHAGIKNQENGFAPSEKYACYAPGDWSLTTWKELQSLLLQIPENFTSNNSVFFSPNTFLDGGVILLLGEAEVWYGKLSCVKCHTGVKPQAESVYDTERTIIPYHTDAEPHNEFIIPLSD